MSISKEEALVRLTARWLEQCDMFPMMREEIPLHAYVRENLPHVMKNGLLAEYSHTKRERTQIINSLCERARALFNT